MRAIVKVKPVGGKGAARVARYIAESKLDPVREGKRRPLFSDKENDLNDRTYRQANQYLSDGRGAPLKKDLIHFSVSFRREDFEQLGAGEDERKDRLREVARTAMAEIQADLNVDGWRWIAGIHLNTSHPHLHIVVHKKVTDRTTAQPRRLGNFPKRMLPHNKRGTDGAIRSVDGSIARHFIAALEPAQERAREAERAGEEKAMALTTELTNTKDSFIDNLMETAFRNLSRAGRDLMMELIERGPRPEPVERPDPLNDIRVALSNKSLDDRDYLTPVEQADELGKQSQQLRDLYERGAEVKGDTLIIPAEEYQVPDERDQIRIINLSHAYEKIRDDPKKAVEFHSHARAIAGETADIGTEIKIFKHYYDLLECDANGRRLDQHDKDHEQERVQALERTLGEMRVRAAEMAKLETRVSLDVVPSITDLSHVFRHIQDYDRAIEFYSLAQAIAGVNADQQIESLVFSYYYGKLERDNEGHMLAPDNEAGRLEAIERTLTEMRDAVEHKLEIPGHPGFTHGVVSLVEAQGHEHSSHDDEEDPFSGDSLDYEIGDEPDDLNTPEYEYTPEEAYGEREAEAAAWQFNTASRKSNLSSEQLRFPEDLTTATKEWLIEVKLPEIDRRIESGASLYDQRDKYGSVGEKGIISDIDRLIRPERDEMLRRVSQAAGFSDAESQLGNPTYDELAVASGILVELLVHEKGELERRREVNDKRDPGEDRGTDRSYLFNNHTAARLGRDEKFIAFLQSVLVELKASQKADHSADSMLYVSLSTDKNAPRLPVGNIRVYDQIERLAKEARLQLPTWAGKDGPALINGFTEREYEYRTKITGFLKSYVYERLRDPETRLIHDNEIFRNAHKALAQAQTPKELNRIAHDLMSKFEQQERPLAERERWLLFNGRMPDHYTREMIELRLTWGLPREGREQALRDGRLPPSQAFKVMLDELGTRRNVESVRNYQKALTTPPEQMRNPGRLPLHKMREELLGHEKDFLYHRAEEMKKQLPGKERPAHGKSDEQVNGRPFGTAPLENKSYKEYLASLGEIKQQLLDQAQSRLNNGKDPISTGAARKLLTRDQQLEVHHRACNLAWERLATAEVFAAEPPEPALRLSETIAKLQEEVQPRARLAAHVLDEFSKDNIPSYANGRISKKELDRLDPAVRERFDQLKDFAGRSSEELYRGFESIDGLRKEIDKYRADERMNDRITLGNVIIAESRYECARLDYETVRDHGETFRFRIHDESLNGNRRISAFDVERRADARASRAADEQGTKRSEERRTIRQEVSALDLSNHSDTLRQHSSIHHSLIYKLKAEAELAAGVHIHAQERAQEITKKYQERGEQLPAPFIDRKTLTATQEQTIRRGLANQTEALEKIRVAQAQEFDRPDRTDMETARLRAQLFVARTDSKVKEERALSFDRTRHLRQWEIDGGKWSLTDVDRRIETLSDKAQVLGRYELHLDPGDRKSARDEIERLTAIRKEIAARTADQQNDLRDKAEEARYLVERLSLAHRRESEHRAQSGQTMPDARFTGDELERIADNAATIRDAEMLGHFHKIERQFNTYADPKERISHERMFARALGRETMAAVFFHESAERLENLRDRKEVQPLLIETSDGRLITHTTKDTQPRSLLEQVTRPLIESPAEREFRETVHSALQFHQQHLMGELVKSRGYYEAARAISVALVPERSNGKTESLPMPEFSPKEQMNIEIYAERLTDQRQREHYLSLIDPGRTSPSSRHDSHTNSDHRREAATHSPNLPAPEVGRGR